MVDRVRLLSEVRAQESRALDLWINKETCDLENIQRLKGILQKHSGEIPVQIIIPTSSESKVSLILEEKISANAALMDEFEEERIWFKADFHYHKTPDNLLKHNSSAIP